jgi:hypothetical protein
MLLNRTLAARLAAALLVGSMGVHAAQAEIGCPPMHDGRPLKSVELFDGPPSEKAELMPEDGRFIVPQRPKPLSESLPNFTLGCTYRGSKEMVTVVLPRGIRVCEFKNYPRVACR